MNQGDQVLEALQLYRIKPGKALTFFNRTIPTDPRRLVIEAYPGVPYYRASYRSYASQHNTLSGRRTEQVTWKMYFVFSAGHIYTQEITLSHPNPPPALTGKQVRQLTAAIRRNVHRPIGEFQRASEQEIAALWLNLELWTCAS